MDTLKVVFLSEWRKNPYKDLLSQHLEKRGLQIRESLWKTFFLPLIFRPWKPNVVHLHTLHPFLRGRSTLSKTAKLYLFVSQVALLKTLGIKVVWTVHEWADKLGTDSSDIPPDHTLSIGRVMHAFIAHGESTQKEIAKSFTPDHPEKVHVIPHGNYIGFYENIVSPQEARKSLDIPEDHVVFLLFGGLYRYKGVLEAIAAFKALESDKATLVIAGKPSEKGLKEEIESEIQDCVNRVIFVPERIPDKDVQLYMNACDCVVVPYKVFTTSGVAVLGMSFGRVCVAPRIGFFCDIFGGSGAFLYEPNDPNGLLKVMSEAIVNRSEIIEMADRNLALAKQWSWDYVAQETVKVYR